MYSFDKNGRSSDCAGSVRKLPLNNCSRKNRHPHFATRNIFHSDTHCTRDHLMQKVRQIRAFPQCKLPTLMGMHLKNMYSPLTNRIDPQDTGTNTPETSSHYQWCSRIGLRDTRYKFPNFVGNHQSPKASSYHNCPVYRQTDSS